MFSNLLKLLNIKVLLLKYGQYKASTSKNIQISEES